MLSNAVSLNDLRVSPANRLEKLGGNRAGNTAFASIISGVFALIGKKGMPSVSYADSERESDLIPKPGNT